MNTVKFNAEKSIKYATENYLKKGSWLAARAILQDIYGRKGIKDEMAAIDKDIIKDILDTWEEIIRQCCEEQAE